MTEFNLSEKRIFTANSEFEVYYRYKEEDVKEFIRLLRNFKTTISNNESEEYYKGFNDAVFKVITFVDKLAGEKLK